MPNMQRTMERIRGLSPAHQVEVYSVVTGKPLLKTRFHSNSQGYVSEERETLLTQFEKYAGWTIPALFPKEYVTGSEEVQGDYQSFGAQAVNSLANKIVTTLFHPARPFFKAEAPEDFVAASDISPADLELQLSKLERLAMKGFAKHDGRTAVTDLVMQLIVTGNGMLHTPVGQNYRMFSYRDYEAEFDTWGNLSFCMMREWINVNTLAPDKAALCMSNGKRENDIIELFTGIRRIAHNHYVVWQELENYCIVSEGYSVYSAETLPYHPQRWQVMPGRQAGIGLIEIMSGDFHTLSCMASADLDLVAIMLDIKTLVKPGGQTKVRELNEAQPGDYVSGVEDDLHSHVHDVSKQTQFLDTKTQGLIRRLSQVFLLNSNAIRDAERVTAEEVRYIAQELDQVHGGFYSRTARTLQRPIAMFEMRQVSPIFKRFKPLIITGLESLSRLSELDNWRGFVGDMASMATVPPFVLAWMNFEKITKKFASGWGVDPTECMFTKEEKEANEQAQLKLQVQQAAAQSVTLPQG